eukprot:818227_1
MMERKPRVMLSRVLIMIVIFIGASSAQLSVAQKKLRFGYCFRDEIGYNFRILDLSSKCADGLCREEVYTYRYKVGGRLKFGSVICSNGKWNIDDRSYGKRVARSTNYPDLKCDELKSGFIPG